MAANVIESADTITRNVCIGILARFAGMLRLPGITRSCAMDQTEVAKKNVAADTQRSSSAYVPPLQRTAGQPPPLAANGGLSYMSFERDGDGGTAKALEDALAQIADGEGQ